jgi:hypothetical protein
LTPLVRSWLSIMARRASAEAAAGCCPVMVIPQSFAGQPIASGARRHNCQSCRKMSHDTAKAPLTLPHVGAYGSEKQAQQE